MHAAEHDRAGLDRRRGAGQLQAVAGEVGQVLDLAVLVVVCEEGGVFAGFERFDLVVDFDHRRDFLVFYVA